jgi:hypothetical protein
MLSLLKQTKIEGDIMPSDAPYCSLAGIFFARAAFVPISFEQGLEPLFQKSQNGLFLWFPFHFELRWDPSILRGFLKMPGLANRGF